MIINSFYQEKKGAFRKAFILGSILLFFLLIYLYIAFISRGYEYIVPNNKQAEYVSDYCNNMVLSENQQFAYVIGDFSMQLKNNKEQTQSYIKKVNRKGEMVASYVFEYTANKNLNLLPNGHIQLTYSIPNKASKKDNILKTIELTDKLIYVSEKQLKIDSEFIIPEEANKVFSSVSGLIRRYDEQGNIVFQTNIKDQLKLGIQNYDGNINQRTPDKFEPVKALKDGENTVVFANISWYDNKSSVITYLDKSGTVLWNNYLSDDIWINPSEIKGGYIVDNIYVDYSYFTKGTQKGSPTYEKFSEEKKFITISKSGEQISIISEKDTAYKSRLIDTKISNSKTKTTQSTGATTKDFRLQKTNDSGFFGISNLSLNNKKYVPTIRYYKSEGLFNFNKHFVVIVGTLTNSINSKILIWGVAVVFLIITIYLIVSWLIFKRKTKLSIEK